MSFRRNWTPPPMRGGARASYDAMFRVYREGHIVTGAPYARLCDDQTHDATSQGLQC